MNNKTNQKHCFYSNLKQQPSNKIHSLLFALIVLFGTSCNILSASTFKFRLLDTSNGLYNNQVRFLHQMTDEKILVYTEGMFNIYNGHTFDPLECDLDQTIPLGMHNTCTAYDFGDSTLWAKDYYHLYHFDMRTARFCQDTRTSFKKADINEPFNDFFLDQDKQAWILTTDGKLYRYNWKQPAHLIYTPSPQEKQHGIHVANVMQTGPFHIIILNTGKLLFYSEKNDTIVDQDSTLSDTEPTEYFRTSWIQADNQHLLISINHKQSHLYLYNIYTHRRKTILNNVYINDFKKDHEGNLWIAGDQTLYLLSPTYQVLEQTDRLPVVGYKNITDGITSVIIDRQGGVWIGLSSMGVLRALPRNHFIHTYTNPLAQKNEGQIIRTLCPYGKDRLLLGTMQGIYLFNTQEKTFSLLDPTMRQSYCKDIQSDTQGNLYISTWNGLYRLTNNNLKRIDNDLIPDNSGIFRFTLPLQDGNILTCMELKELYLCKPGNKTIHLNESNPQLNRSRALSFAIQTAPNHLLIGSQNGLFHYQLQNQHMEQPKWIKPFEKYSTKYNCAHIDTDKTIWIGTQNGLISHNTHTNQTNRYTTLDGLPNNCIQGITTDTAGDLWISTSNGICKIHKDKNNQLQFARLDYNDGIRYGEMMEQSITAQTNGPIYIGNLSGLTEIDPGEITFLKPHLKPTLVSLSIMGKNINNEGILNGHQILPQGMSNTRTIKLQHNQNFFEMTFSALNYDMPWHTVYRYRLEGIDKTWHHSSLPTGICTAGYTAIPPGTYTLNVQATMGYAQWSDTEQWKLIIQPPFWKTWWAYLLYTLIIIALGYYIIEHYIKIHRARIESEQETIKRQKEQQLDELKFRFFTNISHEFRTPLALIITPLQLLINRTTDTTIQNQLNNILLSAKDLLRLVNQLLDFRRLEQKGEQIKPTTIHIKHFIHQTIDPFIEIARQQNITLYRDCQFAEEETFTLDTEKMKRVFNNLLSNALKFTPPGGTITITACRQQTNDPHPQGIKITVADTGIGIQKEDIKHIFTRFYQSNNQQTKHINSGSGIGLHLTKGYIELHGGNITAQSEGQGKGTCFTILLPNTQTQQQTTTQPTQTTNTQPQQPDTTTQKDKTLLIVEDNKQFRDFLKDLLRENYNILTAEDGQQGLNLAQGNTPDLIISDIMMPHMGGYQLCHTLKTNIQTSHIPIILLTAKISTDSRSTSYQAGADSYIEKPFDIDVLNARITQLLQQHQRQLDLFRKNILIQPKEITITSLDENLIAKALQCIEKNMDNTDYDIEQFSADMGMERSTLYRKLQAIANLTPTEFVRTVRLKRAAQLLQAGQYSIQEISWMVGFNTTRYFSSYFKEMYGLTPSQYAKEYTK